VIKVKSFKILVSLTLLLSLISIFHVIPSFAKEKSRVTEISNSIEDIYKEEGYKSFNDSVSDFEKLYKTKPLLPSKFPFRITHQFGAITDNHLTLDFINQTTKEKCKIFIQPGKAKLDKLESQKDFDLRDGTEAIIMKDNPSFYGLKFQKSGLQYIVTISKHNLTKKITESDLVTIAESMK
jgi:hypothetical protein